MALSAKAPFSTKPYVCRRMAPSNPLPTAALVGAPDQIHRVFGEAGRARLAGFTNLVEGIVDADDSLAERLAGVRWIFSTWGMPRIDDATLEKLPDLEALFYAAGTVKPFAEPLMKRNIRVVSAWRSNAVPVAEFSLAQILLASKNYFGNQRAITGPWTPEIRNTAALPVGEGVWDTPVALLGFGAIGQLTAKLLSQFRFDVRVVDPYADEALLERFGVRRVSLEEAFAECEVVSNHLPNLDSLRGLLNEPLFASMRPHATFINTGRGAQVDEAGLIATLEKRPDLTALLDVTLPEPPVAGSPLYTLRNVQLSTHIAGSIGREVRRMAESAMDEAQALLAGKPLQHEVTLDMLDSMA